VGLISLSMLHSVKRLAREEVTPSYDDGQRRIMKAQFVKSSSSVKMMSSSGGLLWVCLWKCRYVTRKDVKVEVLKVRGMSGLIFGLDIGKSSMDGTDYWDSQLAQGSRSHPPVAILSMCNNKNLHEIWADRVWELGAITKRESDYPCVEVVVCLAALFRDVRMEDIEPLIRF